MKKWYVLCLGVCLLMAVQSCSAPITTLQKRGEADPKVLFKVGCTAI